MLLSAPRTPSYKLFFLTSCFFFNDTAPTEIYTLSLHDALPIWPGPGRLPQALQHPRIRASVARAAPGNRKDRKSTRLNSSHLGISYAVFCLKKKNSEWNMIKVEREAQGSR